MKSFLQKNARMIAIFVICIVLGGVVASASTPVHAGDILDLYESFESDTNTNNFFQPILNMWNSIVKDLIDAFLVVIGGAAVIMFLWSLAQILFFSGDATKKREFYTKMMIIVIVIALASNGLLLLKKVAEGSVGMFS